MPDELVNGESERSRKPCWIEVFPTEVPELAEDRSDAKNSSTGSTVGRVLQVAQPCVRVVAWFVFREADCPARPQLRLEVLIRRRPRTEHGYRVHPRDITTTA